MTPQKGSSAEDNRPPLLEANLNQHDDTVEADTNYSEDQVRQEGAQLFEQARCQYFGAGPWAQSTSGDLHGPCPVATSTIQASQEMSSLVHHYRQPPPSTTSIMERFSTASTANDPNRLYAKSAMDKIGITVGSLETIEDRTNAARFSAALEVDDEEREMPSEIVPRDAVRRASRSGVLTIVRRDIRKSKRRNDDDNGEQKAKRQKAE